jgi:gliding motility-associated-like protein
MRGYLFFALCFIFFVGSLQAQLCTGSLGDPVVQLDFGSGTAVHGPALASGITSYTYTSANFPNDGSYTIESTTNTPNTWWTTTDHTGGGYMMVVNASLSISDYFYKNTVSGLCPDTTYEFAAWVMNLLKGTDNSTPNITFTIESTSGTILASYNTGNIPVAGSAVWHQYGFFFTTPAGVDTVVIRMRNNKVGAAPGNDIALDDITFRPCGPTVTSVVADYSSTSIEACGSAGQSYTFNGSITASVYSSPSYQWQVSTDNGATWTDIAGATGTSLTVTPTAEGTYLYRMAAAQGTTIASLACRVVSNLITITVKDAPDAPQLSVTQADCNNLFGNITINSPTGYTYSIDGAAYSSAMVYSNLAEGDYTVMAKAPNGCISDAVPVHINAGGVTPAAPTVNVVQPLTCANPYGSITVNGTAAAYSFDNGVTWNTAATATGLAAGDYQVMVKNSYGCVSAAVTVTIIQPPGFPPNPTVTTVQPDCFTATGSITIQDIQTGYSFDNGATWTTLNTVTGLIPDDYVVVTKNTLGCISNPVTVTISAFVNTEPLPVAAAQTFCIYNNATLADVAISGTNVQWYSAASGGSALPLSTVLQTATYYASQSVTACESNRIAVAITVLDIQAPTGDALQEFCTTQTPTVALLEAQGNALQWYDSAAGGNVLAVTTPLTNGAVYYATQTTNGCESQNRLAVTVSIVVPTVPVSNVSHYVCDELNDGEEVADLTVYTPEITNYPGCTFSYYTSALAAANETAVEAVASPESFVLQTGLNTIYVRVDSDDKCFQVVMLSLTLTAVPVIAVADKLTLCENTTITVSAGQGFDSYKWSTGATSSSIFINQPGIYWIRVTKQMGDVICTTTKSFLVTLSNVATIGTIEVADWTENSNTLNVVLDAASIGNYEYSIDGATYQDSNVFEGLTPGIYTVYVKDKNGCGIADTEAYILNYPKFFTPNGDGYNDSWHVQFASAEPGIITTIFDRYGKVITQLAYNGAWDGTYNGQRLPSTDYWFVVQRSNGKEYKGHFSMLR